MYEGAEASTYRATIAILSFGLGLDTFPERRALADRVRVVLLDRAGFGDSPAREVVLGWPTDVDDLVAVLGEYRAAYLVGQSYGAVVSLLVAGRQPELVRSLVVIEPPLRDSGRRSRREARAGRRAAAA